MAGGLCLHCVPKPSVRKARRRRRGSRPSAAKFLSDISAFSNKIMTILPQFLAEGGCRKRERAQPSALGNQRSAFCLPSASRHQPHGPVYMRLLSLSRTKWAMRGSLCIGKNVLARHYNQRSKVRGAKRRAPMHWGGFSRIAEPSHGAALHPARHEFTECPHPGEGAFGYPSKARGVRWAPKPRQ